MRQHVPTDICKTMQGINCETKTSWRFTYSFEIIVNTFSLFSYFCMPQKAALAIMTETHKNNQFTEVFPAYLTQGAFSLPIICWLDSFSHRNTNSVVGVTDCFCVGNGLLLLKIVLFPTALPSI